MSKTPIKDSLERAFYASGIHHCYHYLPAEVGKLEAELAEFKRQIADGELVAIDVVTEFVAEDAFLTDDEVWKIREAIQQFASAQAKESK